MCVCVCVCAWVHARTRARSVPAIFMSGKVLLLTTEFYVYATVQYATNRHKDTPVLQLMQRSNISENVCAC